MVSSIKVEEMPSMEMDGEPLELPPGFRFHPTDEEIITHYLTKKVANNKFEARAIGEVDLNRCEPWDLSSKRFDPSITPLPSSFLLSSSAFFFGFRW